jgi:O-antigen/teichoic acid export membrane protein
MGPTLLHALASNGFGQLANQVFFFLLLRYLSVSDVGIYSWSLAIATLYTYVADLGLPPFLVGELATKHYSLRIVCRFIIRLRSPVMLVAIIGIGGWAVLGHPPHVEFVTLCLITFAYILQLLDIALVPWFQVREKQLLANLLLLILPVARLVFVAVLLLFRVSISVELVAGIILASQVLSTFFLFTLAASAESKLTAQKHSVAGDLATMFSAFKRRGPTLTLMYTLNIFQARADWLLVTIILSKTALANYSLANKAIELPMLVAGICARTTFPWLSEGQGAYVDKNEQLARFNRLFVVAAAICGFGLFFCSWPIIEFLFGTKYGVAKPALELMAGGTVLFMMNQYFFYVLLVKRREKAYIGIIVASTIVQLVVDSILLPRFGILGAGFGMLALGIIAHISQIILLHSERVFEWFDLLRIETFVGVSIALLASLRMWQFGALAGFLIGAVFCSALGIIVVLTEADRVWLRKRLEL